MKSTLLNFCLIAIMSCVSICAAADDEFNVDGVVYRVVDEENHEVELADFYLAMSSFTVPAEITNVADGVNYTVVGIGDKAFYSGKDPNRAHLSLSRINLPDGLRYIGEMAFAQITSLDYVNIPNTVKEIKNSAFSGCNYLKEISLPIGLEIIGDNAFESCYYIKSIELPSSVIRIGNDAFSQAGLSIIKFNEGLKEIGESAFNKTFAKAITLPASLLTLGTSAFNSCANLSDVTISSLLEEFGDKVFYGCDALEQITLTEGLPVMTKGDICEAQKYAVVTLRVPEDQLESVAQTSPWNKFARVYPISDTPTPELTDVEEEPDFLYDSPEGVLEIYKGKNSNGKPIYCKVIKVNSSTAYVRGIGNTSVQDEVDAWVKCKVSENGDTLSVMSGVPLSYRVNYKGEIVAVAARLYANSKNGMDGSKRQINFLLKKATALDEKTLSYDSKTHPYGLSVLKYGQTISRLFLKMTLDVNPDGIASCKRIDKPQMYDYELNYIVPYLGEEMTRDVKIAFEDDVMRIYGMALDSPDAAVLGEYSDGGNSSQKLWTINLCDNIGISGNGRDLSFYPANIYGDFASGNTGWFQSYIKALHNYGPLSMKYDPSTGDIYIPDGNSSLVNGFYFDDSYDTGNEQNWEISSSFSKNKWEDHEYPMNWMKNPRFVNKSGYIHIPGSIDGILDDAEITASQVIFDLTGRIVDNDQLSPGIYIIGGKKIIIR